METECLLGCGYPREQGANSNPHRGRFVHFLSTLPYAILSARQGIDYHSHFTDGETEIQRLLPDYTLSSLADTGREHRPPEPECNGFPRVPCGR